MALDIISPALVINTGSSSFKVALFTENSLPPICKVHLDWNPSEKEGVLKIEYKKTSNIKKISISSFKQALESIFDIIVSLNGPLKIAIIGHRIVHGGDLFKQPTLLDVSSILQLHSLIPFAPLHLPSNLEALSIAQAFFPQAHHIGVFDTAFHQTLPSYISTYPIPNEWKELGIRRFGFHGISFQYCAKEAARLVGRSLQELKLIICHLGSGASMCAVDKGKSIATTMGFTPLEGLMMATRSGSIDPGILLYLFEQGLSLKEIEHKLNFQSGLFAICGIKDFKTIEQNSKNPDDAAILALEMFTYSVRFYLGAMIGALKGVDCIVFTGGIGENAPQLRKESLLAFSQIGITIDDKKNAAHNENPRLISKPSSPVLAAVIPTQEEFEIAKECWKYFPHSS